MGDDASNTILTYDDYAREIMPDGIKRGTFRTYTLFLDAPDITLCNLTVENAAGAGKEVGQAIALYAEGEGIRVENCRLIGKAGTTGERLMLTILYTLQNTKIMAPVPQVRARHGHIH